MDFVRTLRTHAFDGIAPVTNPDNQGWTHKEFPRVAHNALRDHLPKDRRGMIFEVGTWKGRSACLFASFAKDIGRDVDIVCIDTWLGAPEFWTWGMDDKDRGISLQCKRGYPQVYYTFLDNVYAQGHHDVIAPLPLPSLQAAEVLRYHNLHADVIYIDASHEYDAVLADLTAYWPLLKSGGVLMGDDYDQFWSGVQRAVDDFCERNNVTKELSGVVWTIKKP